MRFSNSAVCWGPKNRTNWGPPVPSNLNSNLLWFHCAQPTLHTTNNLIVAERDHVQTHLCAVSSPTPSLDSTIEQKLLLANNGIEDCQIFIVVGSILGCLLIAASLLMCLLSVRLFKLTKSTSTSHIFTNPEFSICIFFGTKVVFSMKITAILAFYNLN